MATDSKKACLSCLDQLKEHTTIVADTGDFGAIEAYKPTDSTTNPSLILAASALPQYKHMVDKACEYAKKNCKDDEIQEHMAYDYLCVLFGIEILKIIPGRVSTEVDPRLSFDVHAQVKRGREIIALYQAEGIDKSRVLVKLSSTWEGIQAAEILESQHDVHCNMTLIFNYHQAIACADIGATLVSPFVGRIYDWHIKNTDKKSFSQLEDPGVVSVSKIYNYYKKHELATQVMGASFRNVDQIKGLCGCDLLTISPTLLTQLSDSTEQLVLRLSPELASKMDIPKVVITEELFREKMKEDKMATEKLEEGIKKFSEDAVKLEDLIKEKLGHVAVVKNGSN